LRSASTLQERHVPPIAGGKGRARFPVFFAVQKEGNTRAPVGDPKLKKGTMFHDIRQGKKGTERTSRIWFLSLRRGGEKRTQPGHVHLTHAEHSKNSKQRIEGKRKRENRKLEMLLDIL